MYFHIDYMKIHNKLSYRRLEELVYVYYNMQLRLWCGKEPQEPKIDPSYHNEDS